MTKHDQKDNEEITAAGVLDHIFTLRRELEYHRAIVAAAEKGFDDLLDAYGDEKDDPLRDSEFLGHLGAWSHRMSLGLTSVSDVSSGVAHKFHLLCELTHPKPADDEAN